LAGGCSNAAYQGADFTARSFNEDPTGLHDTYLGFDLNFTLQTDEPHVPPRPSPASIAGWNQADAR
jgi:hypothetical protein